MAFTYQIRYVLAGTGSSRLTPCTKFSDPTSYCLFVYYEGMVHQIFAIMMQRIVFLHNFGPGYHELVLRTRESVLRTRDSIYRSIPASIVCINGVQCAVGLTIPG